MPRLHAIVLACCLPLLGQEAAAGFDADLFLGLSGGNRAGWLATGADTGSRFAMDYELVPFGELVLETPRQELSVEYGLRLFTRTPNRSSQLVLLLHQARVSHTLTLSENWRWRASGGLHAGAVDYSRSLLLFDPRASVAGSRPDQTVIRFLSADASAGLIGRLSRRRSLELSGRYATTRPLADGAAASGFPVQQSFRGQAAYAVDATRRDRLDAVLHGGVETFSSGAQFFPVDVSVSWRHLLDRGSSLSLRGGALWAYQDEFNASEEAALQPSQVHVLPSVDLALETSPLFSSDVRWWFRANAGVSGTFDPIRATLAPQATAGVRASARLNARVAARAGLMAMCPVASSGSGEGEDEGAPAIGLADLALDWAVRRQMALSFGIMMNATATNPLAEELRLIQGEAMAYASFSTTVGLGAKGAD